MHLYPLAQNPIDDGFEFRVTIQNAIMPRLPIYRQRIRIRISVKNSDASLILVVGLRRNNTAIVSKDPREIAIVAGKEEEEEEEEVEEEEEEEET